MSGGAWDCKYPQFAEDDEIMQHIDNLRLMAHYCRDHNKTAAAHELEGFINHLVESKNKLSIKFKRVKDLIYSIDWCAAGDTGWDPVDKAVEKLTSNVQKEPAPKDITKRMVDDLYPLSILQSSKNVHNENHIHQDKTPFREASNDTDVGQSTSPDDFNSINNPSEVKRYRIKGTCGPEITIYEDIKEEFKRAMDWDEDQFRNHTETVQIASQEDKK